MTTPPLYTPMLAVQSDPALTDREPVPDVESVGALPREAGLTARCEPSAWAGHTPGPWFWGGGLWHVSRGMDRCDIPVVIASYDYDTGITYEVSDANAALIAAAPQLAAENAALHERVRVLEEALRGADEALVRGALRLYAMHDEAGKRCGITRVALDAMVTARIVSRAALAEGAP